MGRFKNISGILPKGGFYVRLQLIESNDDLVDEYTDPLCEQEEFETWPPTDKLSELKARLVAGVKCLSKFQEFLKMNEEQFGVSNSRITLGPIVIDQRCGGLLIANSEVLDPADIVKAESALQDFKQWFSFQHSPPPPESPLYTDLDLV